MLTAVVALVAAVAVTVAYYMLTDQLDYASVRRRQLDLWAACAAMACLMAIFYGNASIRRSLPEAEPMATLQPRQEPIMRQTVAVQPVVMTPETPEVARVALAEPRPQGPAADLGVDVLDPVAGPAPGPAHRAGSDDGGNPGPVFVVPPIMSTSVMPSPAATADQATPTWEVKAAPSAVAPIIVSPTHEPTLEVPSTPAPTALPTATPHCGDPARMDVRVENLQTRRRSGDGELVVEYSFDLRNRSDFPVTLVDMRVTVSLQGAGTEQFASMFLENVTIEAGAVYPVEKRITLETRPPPFGTVQLCVTYTAESCGRRVPYDIGSRCQQVRGF